MVFGSRSRAAAGFAAASLLLTAGGCGPGTTGPGSSATQLVFTSQPGASYAGARITPGVGVTAKDANGNDVLGYTGLITLRIGNNPGGDTLRGTTTAAPYRGVAGFDDLVIRALGSGYTLIASSGALAEATSDAFDVTGWAPVAPLPTARAGLGVAVVDGVVYSIGGTTASGVTGTVEAFTPGVGWSTRSAMPTPRAALGVGVANGIIYAVGGMLADGTVTAAVEAYDPATDTWSAAAAMPSARAELGVAAVNGVLYAVGGATDAFPPAGLGNVEAYDPGSDTWSTKASLLTPRRDLAVIGVGGLLYAIGGNPGTGVGSVAVEAYDPTADTWTSKADLTTPRANLAAVEVGGVIYALGGLSIGVSAAVAAYDPATDTWTVAAPLLTARRDLGVASVGGWIYAIGGSLGGVGVTDANEAWQP